MNSQPKTVAEFAALPVMGRIQFVERDGIKYPHASELLAVYTEGDTIFSAIIDDEEWRLAATRDGLCRVKA